MYELLKELGIDAENKAKEELSGHSKKMKTTLFKILTPVVFNIQTEEDEYHFVFNKDASVSRYHGLHSKPDVKFSSTHAELLYLLETRDNKRFKLAEKTRKVKIVTKNFRGKEAVMKLRELFLG